MSCFEKFLTRIATSEKIFQVRRRHGEMTVSEMATTENGPLASLIAGESRDALRRAVDQLDDRERQVIILAFIEEFSLTDLATKFGVTESRVYQIRARALRSLREYLVEHEVSGANEAEIA